MKYRAIAFVACFISSLALAGDTWTLDSNTSNARLFQGSKANPDSVNTGVARVTGKIKLDTNVPYNSVFDLSMYPAGEDWGHALSPDGALLTGYVPDAADQTLLTFKSTRILRTGNGRWEVIGDLTLNRAERTVTATPTEAYAGPVYGDPVIHHVTREITFLFPSVSAARLSESLTPAVQQTRGVLEVVGAARVDPEEFPELLSAIRNTNWPSAVQNEHCQAAYSGGGEGYSGPVCTGTLIAATQADNCQATYSGGGEGYSGPVCTPVAGNQTTIALDLKVLHKVPEPSSEAGLAISETPENSATGGASLGDGNAEGTPGSGVLESVRVFDVSDPAHPRTVRNFDGVSSILQDSARNLLYVANGDGVWIVSHQQVLRSHECSSSDAISPLPNCD